MGTACPAKKCPDTVAARLTANKCNATPARGRVGYAPLCTDTLWMADVNKNHGRDPWFLHKNASARHACNDPERFGQYLIRVQVVGLDMHSIFRRP